MLAENGRATMTRRIDELLAEYGESHQNPVNKMVHWVCVPTIFWTIVAVFWAIPVPSLFMGIPLLNWATILLALALVYYVIMAPRLTVGILAYFLICVALIVAHETLASFALWKAALGLFVLAWVGQFWGHKVEGKKTSFFKDVQFLLIGPAWLLGFLYRRAGIPY